MQFTTILMALFAAVAIAAPTPTEQAAELPSAVHGGYNKRSQALPSSIHTVPKKRGSESAPKPEILLA